LLLASASFFWVSVPPPTPEEVSFAKIRAGTTEEDAAEIIRGELGIDWRVEPAERGIGKRSQFIGNGYRFEIHSYEGVVKSTSFRVLRPKSAFAEFVDWLCGR
jgi:hypothetical protein